MSVSRFCGLLMAMSLLAARPALAHGGAGVADGLVGGFLHPLTGLDHLIAMVAVGLWGAQLGRPALWVLPVAFPLVMAIGGLAGVLRFDVPGSELMIALSAVALGCVVAWQLRAPLWAAGALVSVFALFHGYAHGRELPGAADPMAFAAGFVTATGLLHLCGILIGTLAAFGWGRATVRGLGGAIAALGAIFLAQWGVG